MKNTLFAVLFAFFIVGCEFTPPEIFSPVTTQEERDANEKILLDRPENQLKIMSFNIRYDEYEDKQNNWEYRKGSVIDTITDDFPDLFGVQEALPNQMDYLELYLPEYAWFGEEGYGEDSHSERVAIFYYKDKLTLLESGTFWLSESRSLGYPGWDASNWRPCTWGKFKVTATGKEFYYYNSHFDHKGTEARLESGKLIAKEATDKNIPFIFTGDLNCGPFSAPLQALTNEKKGGPFLDTQLAAEKKGLSVGTYHGFLGTPLSLRIDFVLCTPHFAVKEAKIIYKIREGNPHNRFPSDHFPVWALLEFIQ